MWSQQDGEGATKMGGRFKQALRTGSALAIVCTAALAVSVGGTAANERTASLGGSSAPSERVVYVAVGEPTRAPIGWVEFCVEYKPECAVKPSTPRDVVLTPKAWSDMVKVNSWANDNIKPITDLEHWGVVERWNYPDDGQGDCEDYVLLKRRMLMQAGWPREALLITVVRDKKGDGHAVLTVKTNRGEFILDNQETQVLVWNKTGYRFVKRQSQSDPNTWVALGEPHAPTTVSAR
jgi:predicted transglutaminase-like cysteine proteinase